MKRLTTDNPQGNFEKLMNFAYTKHNRVHLSYADGEDDIDLCKYVSKLAKAKGFDFSPDFIMEDGLFDNYDDDFAVLYYLAVQAAELRSRLKLYEDKFENGTLIELPCKVGETVHYITYYKNKYDYHYIINASFDILFQLFHEKEIGYVIYMTDDKTKAEAKLKELNGNENT